MKKPPEPANEKERLESLHSYGILDTEPESEFDDIVKIAKHITGTPLALITFVDKDRQWFKSSIGIDDKETPRDIAFCAYAIHQSDTMVVTDPTTDERFATNPLVTSLPHIRFYAGSPLMTPDGHGLGTLCVVDTKERELSSEQLEVLEALRNEVMRKLERNKEIKSLKKKILQFAEHEQNIEQYKSELNHRAERLRELERMISTDLRTPLRGIATIADWILEDESNSISDEVKQQLSLIKQRVVRTDNLVDGILKFSRETNNSISDTSE
ncbi:MAG: GAF domain-containing protein [Balneolales bacterium]|nr:GAF domain-containing protein [Balneolales bacterium]